MYKKLNDQSFLKDMAVEVGRACVVSAHVNRFARLFLRRLVLNLTTLRAARLYVFIAIARQWLTESAVARWSGVTIPELRHGHAAHDVPSGALLPLPLRSQPAG